MELGGWGLGYLGGMYYLTHLWCTQGVFITTSRFFKEAIEYVQRIEQKVVLIDGELTQMMIDHNVGVSEESRYIVKKIDSDYFDE